MKKRLDSGHEHSTGVGIEIRRCLHAGLGLARSSGRAGLRRRAMALDYQNARIMQSSLTFVNLTE